MPGPRLLLLLGLLVCYVAGDRHAVSVWRSNDTLWPHAAAVAPLKPRPILNHAKQLFGQGREADAIALIVRVEQLESVRGRWR